MRVGNRGLKKTLSRLTRPPKQPAPGKAPRAPKAPRADGMDPKVAVGKGPIMKISADAPLPQARRADEVNVDLVRGKGPIVKIAADAPLSTHSEINPELLRGGPIRKIVADSPTPSSPNAVRVNPDLVAGKGARVKVHADAPLSGKPSKP